MHSFFCGKSNIQYNNNILWLGVRCIQKQWDTPQKGGPPTLTQQVGSMHGNTCSQVIGGGADWLVACTETLVPREGGYGESRLMLHWECPLGWPIPMEISIGVDPLQSV